MAIVLRSVAILLLLNFSAKGFGQITADFSASQREGCSPLKVNFQEQATGNPSEYEWFFGNGNTSDTSDPSVIYITPGNYDVTLIVSDGNASDTIVKEDYITVFANPSADFSANPLSGCAPAAIAFEDQSAPGDAPVNDWLWDFGDGKISGAENPQHTYNSGGSFNVSLRVIDGNGCQSVIAKEDYIEIDEPPAAGFSADKRADCSLPHAVNFDNTSSGQGSISYEWHFGDGGTASQENPSHTYTDTGTYDVMLIAINNFGCRDTVVKENYIRTFDLQPELSVSATHGCTNPEQTEFEFVNNSQGSFNLTFWNFGDNTTSNQQNPTHSYQNAGVYEAKLVVGNGICLDTATQEIHVQQLSAGFDMDSSITCDTPFTVNFTESAMNATSWKWQFGDGDSAAGANVSHTYFEEGEFDVTLTIRDQYGCEEDTTAKVIIDIAKVNIFTTDFEGCAPLTAVLIGQPDSRFPFTGYEWELHDGSTATGQSTTRTYNNAGEYEVKLTGYTDNGCTATTVDTIKVGEPPAVLDAGLLEDSICYGDPVPFLLDLDLADEIRYVFYGENDTFTSRVDTPGMPSATGDPGLYTSIELEPYYNGCPGDEFILNDTFRIMGHKINWTAELLDCSDPYTFAFTNKTVGAPTDYTWHFPDGSTQNTEDATYTFADSGRFEVRLEANSNCGNDLEKTVHVYIPEAEIAVGDTTGCNSLPNVELDGSGSEHAEYFEWTFPDGTVSGGEGMDMATHGFNEAGSYLVELMITAPNGCTVETVQEFTVFQHETAIHNPGDNGGCAPFDAVLESQVAADTNITFYEWDINGDSSRFTKDISVNFPLGGSYTVALKTTDANGCTAQDNITLYSSQPEANFFPDRLEACKYDPIVFENYSFPEEDLSYQWFFGDGGTDTARQPEYGFTESGTFDVMLVVTDTFGCTDTLLREDYIHINAPRAELAVSDSSEDCPPLLVDFIDQSSNDVVSWEWDFGDNSGSVLEAPQHNYTASGAYDVSLIVANGAGCTDTVVYPELINIGGPRGIYTAEPDTGCAPLTVTFTVTEKEDVTSTEWDFGDGRSATGDSVTHTYNVTGKFHPNLVLSNDANCSSTFEAIDTIVVDTMNADFSIADDELCLGEGIAVEDQSAGNISSWHWQIDTFESTGQNVPAYNFDTGQYTAKLIAYSHLGCVDSMTRTFDVFPDPVASVSGDTFACEGSPAQLIGGSNVPGTYEWIPAEGIAEPQSRTPLATPGASTTYSVIATDDHGCSDTSGGHALTIYPDLEGSAGPDTTIVIGDTVSLFVNHNLPVTGYQWQQSATLSCDMCPVPVAFPMTSTDYFVTIADTAGCDEIMLKAEIIVDDAVHVAIPEAFTPNGDGKNDIMFIQGWGIEELLDFRIYNRWGELVFRTSNIDEGWDGMYNGEMQEVGSFVYVVKTRSYSDKVVTKKGSFSLIR